MIPNDGECHLLNGSYTHGEIMDYPTMHHIGEMIRQEKMNVVFAVNEEYESVNKIYFKLVEIIGKNNARKAKLKADEKDIIDLIKEVYNSTRSEVSITTQSTPNYIKVDLYSKCNSDKLEKNSSCTGFIRTDPVQFFAEISLLKCPEDKNLWNRTIKIGKHLTELTLFYIHFKK